MASRFNVLVLNQIAPNGLKRLPAEHYAVSNDVPHPDAVLVDVDSPVGKPVLGQIGTIGGVLAVRYLPARRP